MKRLFFVTDEEGNKALSILRTALGLISAALITVLLSWFIWVSTQAYDVATNKTLIRDTGVRLERSIDLNKQDIIMNAGEVEDTFNRVNGILHGRITKVDDKYDAKISELQKLLMDTNRLIVQMLIEKNKDIQLQKKELELKKEKVEIQQQMQQQQRIAPKWPVSPANGD
jgi:hypothetical protein